MRFGTRLGKPSDNCRSVFQTEGAKEIVLETAGQFPNVNHQSLDSYADPVARRFGGRHRPAPAAMPAYPHKSSANQCAPALGLESRATIVARFSKPRERRKLFLKQRANFQTSITNRSTVTQIRRPAPAGTGSYARLSAQIICQPMRSGTRLGKPSDYGLESRATMA